MINWSPERSAAASLAAQTSAVERLADDIGMTGIVRGLTQLLSECTGANHHEMERIYVARDILIASILNHLPDAPASRPDAPPREI